ncbi:hypothetical protein [Microvirga roseola]|uniref:hypothetical protein n=1 Tax=Microvirga roseola TaxID=2883126 RepID=UPI001E2AA0ED|nr:hypothetical protein [Microvirga roseola]
MRKLAEQTADYVLEEGDLEEGVPRDKASLVAEIQQDTVLNQMIRMLVTEVETIPEEALEVWEGHEPDETSSKMKLTEQHLMLIRRPRFAWSTIEVGAPRVDTEQPYGSPDPLKDIAAMTGKAPVPKFARRHADMTTVLNSYLRQFRLQPGTYGVEGRPFELTQDHLTLAKRMWFEWDTAPLEGFEEGSWPRPAIDPKRPYGSFSFYQQEMAIHLGWLHGEVRELTEDEMSRLTEMHHEMLDAMRVIAAQGTIAADSAP